MTELGRKQRKLPLMIAQLIIFAKNEGYDLTFGDAKRPNDCPYGRKYSLHKDRLAVDFNLFKGDKYLTKTSDHEFLGIFWESIGGSWGGRFNDGNHYSIAHNGRR